MATTIVEEKKEGKVISDPTDIKESGNKEEGHIVYTVEVKEEGKWQLFKTDSEIGKKKVARTEKKETAIEIRNNILDKKDVEAARIVYGSFAKGGFVAKRTEEEVTKEQRADEKKNEIPEDLIELYGKDRAEQLQYMDENERGAVLHLLKQVRAKTEELNTFGVLAAQRSGFRSDTTRVNTLKELKESIMRTKTKYVEAKETYETTITAGKEFAEEQMKDYPHLYKWVLEQLELTEKTNVNSKTRIRTGVGAENGKKALIYKMFKEQEGKGKRLRRTDIAKIMEAKGIEGDWKPSSIGNPLTSLKHSGYISEDDEEKYFIP